MPNIDEIFTKVIRSWKFILCQLTGISLWMAVNHFIPSIAWDNKSFDILRLVLAIESSFIGSIILMSQHRQSEKDRMIIYKDYILDCQIKKEVKEIRPLIEALYKDLEDRKKL